MRTLKSKWELMDLVFGPDKGIYRRGLCLEACIIKSGELQNKEIPWEEADYDGFIDKYAYSLGSLKTQQQLQPGDIVKVWREYKDAIGTGWHYILYLGDYKFWDSETGETLSRLGHFILLRKGQKLFYEVIELH
jgi:hypothetical protein